MKKLSLLLTLFLTASLFACLQANPVSASHLDGIQKATTQSVSLVETKTQQKRSSGVTVIIWP